MVFIHFSVHINSRKCYALQENEVPLAFSFHRFGTFPDIPPDVRSRPRAPSAAPTLQCPRGPRPSGPGRVTWSPMAGKIFFFVTVTLTPFVFFPFVANYITFYHSLSDCYHLCSNQDITLKPALDNELNHQILWLF